MAGMPTPKILVRAEHPDFLDLPWEQSLTEWNLGSRLLLPKGISRHEVQFYGLPEGIYAIKELPLAAARREWEMLRGLEEAGASAVRPVGFVERPWVDPGSEHAAAVITGYLHHAFSYRELVSGWGFGERRNQMLDAFAGLLVELHLIGCFWGDCSLSNVLYRYDAGAIEVTMVDAETAQMHETLTPGQRTEDLEIMVVNVAGGMADIAAEQGADLDDADLHLGEDIARRYESLWAELTSRVVIARDEQYRVTERIARMNELGFEVVDLELVPFGDGHHVRMEVTVGGRTFHSRRLRELTGVDASENQARQILSDLRAYEARTALEAPSRRQLSAILWRIEQFEPTLERIRLLPERHTSDPVQAYCDMLHHRYVVSAAAGRDLPTDEAFEDWVAAGQPGYPLA
jgi:hypothetical protein